MEPINPKLFTLLALRDCIRGAQTEESRKAFQDAYDKRLSIIGSVISGEPRPKGMFLRVGELTKVGLTPADALEHYKLARLWFSVGQFSGQYNLKGDAPYVPFLGGD
jgi:hypothetical protein